MARSGLRVLVVGGGGREHALAWALSRCASVSHVACAPGNAGTRAIAENHAVPAEDVPGVVALAVDGGFDLVVVGPEKPLVLGLADALVAAGVRVFGCSQAASAIEASKAFAKDLMVRAGVPTARYGNFTDAAAATAFARELLADAGRVVVKADGLAAGKGVVICEDAAAIDDAVPRLLSGGQVVVEEFLVGREASCMAFVDGERVYALPACEDHKTIFDGDQGPMTGGMGAVSPTPVVDEAMLARVEREVLVPTARALVAEGRPFRGLLYAGMIVTASGPKVLEFNCRFGDPETEALLPRLGGDLAQALLAIAEGRAPSIEVRPEASCTVVMAARGYPGTVEKGAAITGLDAAAREGAVVFHAGTRLDGERLLVDGGRVLAVTATGADLDDARARAYRAVDAIRFDGAQVRRDIGARGRRD